MNRRLRFDQLALLVILAVAFFFRVWKLGLKPPHFDEGINGHFVNQMWVDGFYRYDPKNFHGPLYFYFLQFAELVFGPNLIGYRMITGFISLAATWGVAQHRRFFGRAAIWAALLTALSPAFVFYSRYAIHESLFILFQVIFSYGFFEFFSAENSGNPKKLRSSMVKMACGFFGTLMVKETLVIFFATWLIAYACARYGWKLTRRGRESTENLASPAQSEDDPWWPDAVSFFSIGGFVTLMIFSGFFLNPHGVIDLFEAFMFWTKTGTGATGHEKPFPYWIKLLAQYEWPFMLGLALTPIAFFARSMRVRFLAFFGFGTWLAYSLVPYKTPWLILNMLWPAAILAGFFIEWLIAHAQKNSKSSTALRYASVIALVVIVGAVVNMSAKMARLNFVDYVNPLEPYVYVQTTKQYQTVMDVVDNDLVKRPEDLSMRVAALNKDPWPLPFTLEKFPNLQWGKVPTADLKEVDVVLIDAVDKLDLENRLKGKFWVMPFKIRDAYEDGFAYLDFAKFSAVIPPGLPVFESPVVTQ